MDNDCLQAGWETHLVLDRNHVIVVMIMIIITPELLLLLFILNTLIVSTVINKVYSFVDPSIVIKSFYLHLMSIWFQVRIYRLNG
jgi:hypothetical protein